MIDGFPSQKASWSMSMIDDFFVVYIKKLLNKQSSCWWVAMTFMWHYYNAQKWKENDVIETVHHF